MNLKKLLLRRRLSERRLRELLAPYRAPLSVINHNHK